MTQHPQADLLRADDLQAALAKCREAFDATERDTELENLWMAAMGEPLAVPDYVRSSVDALKAQIEKLKFANSVNVLHRDEITKTCNELQAKIDAMQAQTAPSRELVQQARDAMELQRPVVEAHAEAAHLTDGFKRKERPEDWKAGVYLEAIAALNEWLKAYGIKDAPRMKIYISGPMTGLPDYNRPAFHLEAARLRALGYDVANPAEIPEQPSNYWHVYMRLALAMMLECDCIAMLPGWPGSRGALIERKLGRILAMHVCLASDITQSCPQRSVGIIGERAA